MKEDDVTRTLQNLRRSRRELERHVQERTEALAKANEALQAQITARKRAEEELASRNRQLLTLHRISEIALGAYPPEKAFQEIVEEISSATAFPGVAIELYDEARQKMVFKEAKGIPSLSAESTFEVPVDETLSGIVARTGQPLVETNAWERPEYAHEVLRQAGCQTFVCVPMRGSERVIGVLSLASPERIRVDDGFLQMVIELGNYLASLIERNRAETWLTVAGEVFAMERLNYRERGIEVEQVFPPDLPLIYGDRDKLKQALLNLCKNAAESSLPTKGRPPTPASRARGPNFA